MKPLADYSFIKGVNYGIKDDETALRDLGYAKRVGLNSVRLWLSYKAWENEGQPYLDRLVHFTRLCHSQGFSLVPILFNGNGMDAAILESDFLPRGEAFARAVVDCMKDEPGLLMYDVMNEPSCTDLIFKAPSEEIKAALYEKIWRFVRHFCQYIKSLDPINAITVGNFLATDLETSADLVDVLSYHDYSPTLKGVRAMAELALSVSKKYGKPVINNETCCIARANPYDLVIETLNSYGIPWYIFNLMIDGYWNDVHGLFYPDGTVRDTAAIAAIMGCYRNRNLDTIIPEKPNRERHAFMALERLQKLLSDCADAFEYGGFDVIELLEVCEFMANLLESGQMVPMQVPPTARIYAWRKMEHPPVLEIKNFAYQLARQLKESCHIL
ncbi:MAG: hypothetical protein E7324_08900 [Clostridiales bacterium]|nr:hypothetical protein [Clostridiales bacterium]